MGSEGVEADVIPCKTPSPLPFRWEVAKVRLGSSVQCPLTLAEQLGRWQGLEEAGRKVSVVMPQGLGAGEGSGQGRAGGTPGMLGDLASLPCLALGTPSCCPLPKGCPWPHF